MSIRPEVVLVGPVPPWRSGIADQTARLARATARLGVASSVVTFRRMYPRAVYPGRSDRDRGEPAADLSARPLLDGLDPLSFRAAARMIARDHPRLVVVPWWTAWWAPHVVLLLRTLERATPQSVRLLLCHNVADHGGGAVQRRLARAVFARADRLVAQSRSAAEELARVAPGRPVELVLHPSEAVEVLPERDRARAQLGVPPGVPLFLFTGILRPYKGWDVLLAAFPRVAASLPGALLVLAGEPWGEARSLAGPLAPPHVRLELHYMSAEERGLWLAACDAVVCPYRHATGSGIAADAFAHARPVIGSDVPGLADVVEDGVNGLLVPPGDPDALAAAMTRFVADGLAPRLTAGVLATRGRFSPDEHARRVLRFGGIDVR